MLKKLLKIFASAGVVGFIGEGLTGWLIRLLTGKFFWIYHEYPLFKTTSLLVAPLWGISGLIFYVIMRKMGVCE